MSSAPHADDEFHPPTSGDPYWTETCWFTFAVPERRLSGQLYPFFRRNQNVAAGGAYFWDASGDSLHTCRYAKNFWHLPLAADARLSDLALANGFRVRCLEPLTKYALGYDDPDEGALHVELTFTAVAKPNYLGHGHLDQPGRYQGEIVLDGETIRVDSFGFRDRSWGVRPQFGPGLAGSPARRGGYSYATSSERDAFHSITMDFGQGCVSIHGYLLKDGVWSRLASGRREVLERDAATGAPLRVAIEGADELGRALSAEGRCLNQLALHLNPNLFTVNCLTEWRWSGVVAYGEDHDNWSAPAARRFFRDRLDLDAR